MDNGLPLSADEVFDFVQEMGNIKLILQGIGVTQNISFLVLNCDAKTWSPPKKDKTVLDNGLPLSADEVFDFVQEMGNIKLILQGIGVTQNISFLVLDCDAKTWSPAKRIKLCWIMDCLYALIRCLNLYKRWET